jgi:hypothetical protein
MIACPFTLGIQYRKVNASPVGQTVITELGREAIQENAQWLILRRSRPLELPLG